MSSCRPALPSTTPSDTGTPGRQREEGEEEEEKDEEGGIVFDEAV